MCINARHGKVHSDRTQQTHTPKGTQSYMFNVQCDRKAFEVIEEENNNSNQPREKCIGLFVDDKCIQETFVTTSLDMF